MENNSQLFDSPKKSNRNDAQSPTKLQQNQSEFDNQGSPDKEKKTEKTKAEAKISLQNDTDLARKLLLDGQIQQSLDLCFKTIFDHKEALGGENSIFLLPGYFVLAEAFIHDGKIKKAVEFMLAASWNFLKFQNKNEEKKNEQNKETKPNESIAKVDDDVSDEEYVYYKSCLHKTFSKLYNAENNVIKALDELKIAIYLDSKKYGAEDIRTSFNYYHLGTIFVKKRCANEAEGCMGKVSEIWYKFLKKFTSAANQNESKLNESLDELLVKEAFVILKLVEEYFKKNLVPSNNLQFAFYSKNLYALALLHSLVRDDGLCIEYFQKVYNGYQEKFGEDHKKTKKTKEILEMHHSQQDEIRSD